MARTRSLLRHRANPPHRRETLVNVARGGLRALAGSALLGLALTASPAAAQWAPVAGVPAEPVLTVRAFGDTIAAGTLSHAYVSTDAGTTWQPSASLPPKVSVVQSVLVRNGVLYAGTGNGGVLASHDLGQSWQPFNEGLVGGLFDTQLDVSDLVVRGDSLYAGTFGAGVYVRHLGAIDTWHHFGEEFEPNQASNIRGLAVGGTRLFAMCGANGSVFFRDPGDPDWTVSWLDNVGLHPGLEAFDAVWTGTGLVVATGVGQRVFSSASGQGPWAIVNLGLGLLNSGTLATRGHHVFGAFNRTNDVVIADSGDDGLSWNFLDDLPGELVFQMATVGTDLYGGMADGLFRRSTATVSVPPAVTRGGLRLALAESPVVHDVRLRFDLPEAGDATIEVFDVGGRRMRRLAEPALGAGRHEVAWSASDLSPGVYTVRLVARSRQDVIHFVRLR